jgi:hypothetical protein
LQSISLIFMRCTTVTNSTSISSSFGPCKSTSLHHIQIISICIVITILSKIFCRMQALDERKTNGRWKVAYLYPQQVSNPQHTFIMSA